MKKLIKHILQESSKLSNILNVIEDEGIFAAAELVGGLSNLKRILKDEPEFKSLIESLYGKLNLIYHSRKEYIEFPVKFEIVGIQKNTWNSNSWPIVNLIYDDSKFYKEEKELFDQFVYDTIGDLNIGDVDIKPDARDMFKDGSYMSINFVNGKNWERLLDHDLRYDDKDMKHLYRLYMKNNKLNESRRLTENEEDPTQKILNFLLRRYKVEETNLGDWRGGVILKQISFDANGQRYSISNFQNKKDQIKNIVDMLTEHNVIEPIDPYRRELDPYAQKVIRAIKTFINQVM
jgi:hypothetical protein